MKNRLFFQVALIIGVIALPFCLMTAEEGSAKPRLGPGTLITIAPDIKYESAYNRADLVEAVASLPEVNPELAKDIRFNQDFWAKDVRFQRDIWCLQFSFKPVRIVAVDIPNKEGTLEKKLVWYMVYNVKNLGPLELEKVVSERTVDTEGGEQKVRRVDYDLETPGSMLGTEVEKKYEVPRAKDSKVTVDGKTVEQTLDTPLEVKELPGTFQPRPGEQEAIRFVPQFTLAIERLVLGTETVNDPETGEAKSKTHEDSVFYVDQYIPLALPVIIRREGMTALPETMVTFPRKELKSGEDRWGVAMWTDVDPRIHRFSIFVSGLTNAYQWSDDGSNTGKPGEGRSMKRKVLKTNWWRIGDQFNLNDGQIQYGYPGEIDYEWLFL